MESAESVDVMEDLAPHIFRQRLLIEGFYTGQVDEVRIREYFSVLIRSLGLTTYQDPVVHSSNGIGKPENRGFEGFVPLIESGISIYTFEQDKFFSVLMITCKPFQVGEALRVTREFFSSVKLVHKSF